MCFEEPILVDETEWISQLYCRVPKVFPLIQAKHLKTKTVQNLQNSSSPRSKTQDVSGIGCVCQQAQLICVANLL